MSGKPKIYVSHVSKDNDKVESLRRKLTEWGYESWTVDDTLPGQKYRVAIGEAFEQSDLFIACLSNSYVSERGEVQREMRMALDIWREKLPEDIYLIPVRLEECKIPDDLKHVGSADIFGEIMEGGWEKLRTSIGTSAKKLGLEIRCTNGERRTLTGIVQIIYECQKLLRNAVTQHGDIWFLGLTSVFAEAHNIRSVQDEWDDQYRDEVGIMYQRVSDEFTWNVGAILGGTSPKSRVHIVNLEPMYLKTRFLSKLYRNIPAYKEELEHARCYVGDRAKKISSLQTRIERIANAVRHPIAYRDSLEWQAIVTKVRNDGTTKPGCVWFNIGTGNVGKKAPTGFYTEVPEECEERANEVESLYKRDNSLICEFDSKRALISQREKKALKPRMAIKDTTKHRHAGGLWDAARDRSHG